MCVCVCEIRKGIFRGDVAGIVYTLPACVLVDWSACIYLLYSVASGIKRCIKCGV